MIKFTPIKCPECGELAEGTLEKLEGRADFGIVEEDGKTEYSGQTTIFWDSQRTESGEDGKRWTLLCHNGHDWLAEWGEIEEQPDQSGEEKSE